MERSLYFSALAMGIVAWACSLLLSSRRAKSPIPGLARWLPAPYRFAVVSVPLVGFLATFPKRPPFAAGQGLGLGLLIGSVSAILALWAVARDWHEDEGTETGEARNVVSVVTPFAIALVATLIPLIWMRDRVVDALFGVALGWLTTTLLLLAGINVAQLASHASALVLAAGTGFVAALCGVGVIGEMGGNVRVGSGLVGVPWSAPLMLLSGFLVFTLLLCALPPSLLRHLPGAKMLLRTASSLTRESSRHSGSQALRWIVGGLLFVALGTQFGHRIGGQPNLFRLLTMGFGASGLAWWMLAGQARNKRNRGSWLLLALPTLILMAAGMVAFQMLSGVGVAVMLLGAWLTMGIGLVGAQEIKEEPDTYAASSISVLTIPSELLRLLLFGTLLLLYRLFQVRFHNDLQNVLLPDHYALLGFIVGAAAPAALAQYQVGEDKETRRQGDKEKAGGEANVNPQPGRPPAEREGHGKDTTLNPLLRMLIAGILLLFVPALLLILFGTKCLLCLFFGLALATVIGTGSVNEAGDRNADGFYAVPGDWLTGLFALGIGLAVAQWTAHILPITLMARTDKTRLLTYLTGTVAILLFVVGLFGRIQRATAVAQTGGAK